MNIYAISGLLNGIAAILLGGLVLARGTSDPRHRTFGFYCFSIAIWGFFYGVWQLAETEPIALQSIRVCMVGAILIPVSYFHHIVVLLDEVPRHKRFLYLNYVLAGCFILSAFSPLFIHEVTPRLIFPFWPVPGLAFHFFLIWFGLTICFTTFLLWKAFRHAHGNRRNQYLYLFVGSIIGYVGGGTNFPLWYDIPLPPLGTIAVTIFVSLTAYTMLRYRLLEVSEALEKGITYLVLLVLMTLPAYGILILLERVFLGQINTSFSLLLLLVFGFIIIGSYTFWTTTQPVITRTLFPEQYDKYETLSNFSKALLTILDLKTLSEEIVHTLSKVMEVSSAAVFVKTGTKNWMLLASSPPLSTASISPDFQPSPALLRHLATTQTLIMKDDLRDGPFHDTLSVVIDGLDQLGAELCLPFLNQYRLIGFCTLGARNIRETYSSHDLELLNALAQEATIALDNALLYEELKRSQAVVHRTDRLRSLETMAGGLAHEIRHPLTSIKAFMQLVPTHAQDGEFLQRVGSIVSEDVARIERLTKEILEYSRPAEPTLKEEYINEIIESCLHTIRNRPSLGLITVETRLTPDLPNTIVDRQQIKQVLLNFFLNALEAMNGKQGRLRIVTRSLARSKDDLWVQIEISDTGTGISTSDLEHIFDPFFTTRGSSQGHEGTGLGLAIAHQIVHEHRGYIEVKSTPGQGTTFLIMLPAVTVPMKSQT